MFSTLNFSAFSKKKLIDNHNHLGLQINDTSVYLNLQTNGSSKFYIFNLPTLHFLPTEMNNHYHSETKNMNQKPLNTYYFHIKNK